MEQSRQGARMLHLALELDRRVYRDIDAGAAVIQLRGSGRFKGSMLDALDNYSPTKAEFETRQLPIRDLRPAMVLDEDIVALKTKLLILKEGIVLTPIWIERLGNFACSAGVQERVRVRVPKLAGIGLISQAGHGPSGTEGKRG